MPSTSLSPTPIQAQAWIHALTPGEASRRSLAESLADGANPWEPSAVVTQWRTHSMSMPEAVVLTSQALGIRETRERMTLLANHTPKARNQAQRRAAMAVVEEMLKLHFPVQEITPWLRKSRDVGLTQSRHLSSLAFDEALTVGGRWGGEAIGWVHRRLLPWPEWTSGQIEQIESCEDPLVRDAYWRMLREQTPQTGARRAP